MQVLSVLILGMSIATAMSSVFHQMDKGSLKTTLHALTRKDRSPDSVPSEYYGLRSFKHHGDNLERKYEREQPAGQEYPKEEGEIEFLPMGSLGSGQLETIGDGYQIPNINKNILFGRALIDYLESPTDQGDIIPSISRERDQKPSYKRISSSEYQNDNDKELAEILLDRLQEDHFNNLPGIDENNYMEIFQNIYNRYRDRVDEGNKNHKWEYLKSVRRNENGDENFLQGRDRDENILYVIPTEKRNANSRYTLKQDFKTFRNLSKRNLVAKRSPASHANKRQITDPKITQDLGVIFGTQTTEGNSTRQHDHHVGKNQEHDHESRGKFTTSKTTYFTKGQVEKNMDVNKRIENKTIEIKKKNIDWSEYFGIDRRRKKATFLAKPETQNQDDEWLLQRYYKSMAENLKSTEPDVDKDISEKTDTFTEMDTRLKKIKDMIIEEALKYTGSEDRANLQEVKDKVISRLAAAYSVEKMRKALNEFKSNLATQQNPQEDSNIPGTNKNKSCTELMEIARRCRTIDNLPGVDSQRLYFPCIILQVCRACVENNSDEECTARFAMEAIRICDGQGMRESCTSKAFILSQLQPPTTATVQCRTNGSETCLRRVYYRYLDYHIHRPLTDNYIHSSYEGVSSQTSDQ